MTREKEYFFCFLILPTNLKKFIYFYNKKFKIKIDAKKGAAF
jgi:hypothetical protein